MAGNQRVTVFFFTPVIKLTEKKSRDYRVYWGYIPYKWTQGRNWNLHRYRVFLGGLKSTGCWVLGVR